jgi:hypothetical protein
MHSRVKFYVRVLDRDDCELIIEIFEFNTKKEASEFAREHHLRRNHWIKIYNEYHELIAEILPTKERHEHYA